MRSHHAQLTLNRLSDEQIRDMVQRVVARTEISPDTIEALVKRTTGVPLFVEELTRAVLDSRENEQAPEIPLSLHDSLMARLDRLGRAKEVAQIGSVIGRQFSYQILRALAPMPEEELQTALSRLCDAELLFVQGFPPDASYTFKHALIQEAAYEALLKSRRRELHRKAAQAISEKFKDIATPQYEPLARHLTAAGEKEAAIAAWTKAGDSARWRYAFKEAEEDYRQALAIVSTVPESSDRDAQELQLTSALLLALSVTKGYAAQETIEATTRARKLAESTGNFRRHFLAITGAGNTAVSAGDYRAAAELADRALDLAQDEGSPTSLAIAHRLQLESRFYCGDPVGAEQHFARGREFFADPRFKRGAGGFASSFGHAAFAAWAIGRADVALGRCSEALANAREINSPFDQAFALMMEGVLQIQMREPEKAETAAAEAMALSDQHGFPQLGAIARIALGWARANTGRTSQGIALIREGLAAATATGARVSITIFLTSLAEAYALAGALPEALETVEQALQANPKEIAFRPYAMRLRAELRFRSNQPELAEADLREAVATARKMGAKSYELRATTLLARWLASQGARDEARVMLRAIYGNFELGFKTRDLIEAKTLLDELGDN
jgi:tetratricopeptide (TPR) repeat protein